MRSGMMVVAVLTAVGGCSTTGTQITFGDDADVRILFIGNSLTYVNDVPGLLQAIARREDRRVATLSITAPDLSLEDHWHAGAPAEIRRLRPDIVVLQQGPSSLPENREHLVLWTERYAGVIREAGGEPALYMVWPDAARRFAFGAVEQSYAQAAASVEGTLLPAGTTWLEAWTRDDSLPLYGPDGFHPSYTGSVAAALTIYAALFAVAAGDLPTGHPQVPESVMSVLRDAVAASVEKWRTAEQSHAAPGAERGVTRGATPPRPGGP